MSFETGQSFVWCRMSSGSRCAVMVQVTKSNQDSVIFEATSCNFHSYVTLTARKVLGYLNGRLFQTNPML